MMTHQTDSKAIFHRIMDLHSVINQESLWSAKDPVEPKYDPSEVPGWRSFREMAAEIGSKMKRSAKTPEERHKERESWLIRLLVHTLRDGPTKFSQILESAAYSGRGDVQAIRRVGDILGVHVERRGDDEIWSISRE